MFVQEFVYNNINVSWIREESIPSDFRCYTASLEIAAEGIGSLDREPFTWMGPNIGLYAAVEMGQNDDGSLTVISELDGYTKTVIPNILPQNSQFRYVVAFCNNIFWTICYCGDNNEMMQSNSSTAISFDFEIRGATALSESILFIVDGDNGRIIKYDVVNNEILASTTGYIQTQDLAISLDKKFVYYTNFDNGIIALNATDLSFYRSYSTPTSFADFEIYGIEVTPTSMWINFMDWDSNKAYLARVTLHNW
jgi:hypothetical protein